MSRTIIFVVKDVFATQFMQAIDVFEPWKFVGHIAEATQDTAHSHLTAKEILDRLQGVNPAFATVGAILPYEEACFLPNHKVMSDGEKWFLTADLVKSYGVKQPCET